MRREVILVERNSFLYVFKVVQVCLVLLRSHCHHDHMTTWEYHAHKKSHEPQASSFIQCSLTQAQVLHASQVEVNLACATFFVPSVARSGWFYGIFHWCRTLYTWQPHFWTDPMLVTQNTHHFSTWVTTVACLSFSTRSSLPALCCRTAAACSMFCMLRICVWHVMRWLVELSMQMICTSIIAASLFLRTHIAPDGMANAHLYAGFLFFATLQMIFNGIAEMTFTVCPQCFCSWFLYYILNTHGWVYVVVVADSGSSGLQRVFVALQISFYSRESAALLFMILPHIFADCLFLRKLYSVGCEKLTSVAQTKAMCVCIVKHWVYKLD